MFFLSCLILTVLSSLSSIWGFAKILRKALSIWTMFGSVQLKIANEWHTSSEVEGVKDAAAETRKVRSLTAPSASGGDEKTKL